jgi:hypothetical protein
MLDAADVPAVAHLALRMEWADGNVYEIDAERPFQVDLSVKMPELWREIEIDPHAIVPRLDPVFVELSLCGNPQHPIVMQTRVKSDAEPVTIDRADLDRLLAVPPCTPRRSVRTR